MTDLATAELVKGAANAFLATKISFINTVSDLCDAAGADVVDLAAALGMDPRIGSSFLDAGLGFGGGCLPKDIRGFGARAAELGVSDTREFLDVVDRINTDRRTKVVELATDLLDGVVPERRIAILGFAFKPGSDDIRDSAALAVASKLAQQGAQIWLHDPRAVPAMMQNGWHLADTVESAVRDAELVLHLTEWAQYRDLDPAKLFPIVRRPCLVDARNKLDAERWRKAGWTVKRLGRGDGRQTSEVKAAWC